jgi:CRISPR-associated endonuclease Csn1
MKDYVLKDKPELASNEMVWAFDLGKGSIGEAVRRGNEFLHKASLLIPAEFSETKTAAGRRRMWRTRLAHKAREQWLEKVMRDAGIEVLKGRQVGKVDGKWTETAKGDPRLEREFPAPGDDTCYTSCLLRIKLLRGEKLEPWQVFKAFHSAIQRRGYDKDIPWKTRAARKIKDGEDDEAGTEQRMHKFEQDLESMAPGKTDFHFPAYFDAYQMGLWGPAKPDELRLRSDCQAKTTRKQIAPRKLVEAEIRKMVEGAAKHYPTLAGKADFLLYGPAQQRYASYKPELREKFNLREGGATDWQGVVGQKIPRFENRIIGKCVLIPRLNVCKIRADKNGELHPRSRTAVEVTFLMKLKNMRVQRGDKQTGLAADEIKSVFENKDFADYEITDSEWRKKVCQPLGLLPVPGLGDKKKAVEKPRLSGRSRFCRPALDILKRLILSGMSPKKFHNDELKRLNGNLDPMKGLVEKDLKFLLEMGDTWEGVYIPNQKLDAIARIANEGADASRMAINNLIASQNDPIVRHRLQTFVERLDDLAEKFGTPDAIILEFIREDFLGNRENENAPIHKYLRFQAERRTARELAREDAKKANLGSKADLLKMELLRLQVGQCLYTGDALIPTSLGDYHIDHIVPRSRGGPDAMVNYVLTKQKTNDEKGQRTPHEWLFGTRGWDAYVKRVDSLKKELRNKKIRLLVRADAHELVQKYTALAETAWISKLAQTIIGLRFGWPNGVSNGERKVTIVSGGLTGRIRRKYALNQVLNPNAKTEEEAEKKNRDDDRHHALDAMVISFIPGWARDAKKESFFRFPESVHKNAKGFFEKEIQSVKPRNIALQKPAFEETIYGQRTIDGHRFIVGRESLASLAIKTTQNSETLKKISDIEFGRIVDAKIQKDVKEFWESNPTATLESWKKWCADYRLGANGPRVNSILVKKSKEDAVDEYKNVSKAGVSSKRGQYKRGAKHRGYYIYERPAPTRKEPDKMQIEVCPVFVFQSKKAVQENLLKQTGIKMHGYFESGCQVRTKSEWEFQKQKYPADEYILGSVWSDGRAKLRHPVFGEIGPITLRVLFNAGFQRI